MSSLPISVIVPHKSSRKKFFENFCLPSIEANKPTEIIVMENNGTAGIGSKFKNEGMKKATQPYLFFCDDDLILAKDCLSRLLNVLETERNKDSNIRYAYGNFVAVVLTDDVKVSSRVMTQKALPFDAERLREGNYIPGPSLVFRKGFPGFNEGLARYDDWDTWISMLEQGFTGVWVDDVLFHAYYLDKGISNPQGDHRELLTSIKERHRIPAHREFEYTISIAVHQNVDLTKKCIDSILKNTVPDTYEIIVTDNASTDGTPEYLDELQNGGQPITIIKNQENVGFGKAHNKALEQAKGKYFVVMNNDLTVPEYWERTMRGEFDRNWRMAICGVKNSCCTFSDKGIGQGGDEVEYVEASCLMIPTALAKKHGLFSDKYKFAYCEDTDLSFRMRALGYDIALAPLNVRHVRAATTKLIKDKIDIQSIHDRNVEILHREWEEYFKARKIPKTVLIRRTAALGDVILTTPVIRALMFKWPKASITVKTSFSEVFQGNPNVNNDPRQMILPPERFDEYYDLDMAYENNPQQHIVDAYAKVCGVTVKDYRPYLYPNPEEICFGESKIPEGLWAVLHPGSSHWPGKEWGSQKFTEVSRFLREKGIKVALVGNHAPPIPCDLDLRSGLKIQQLAAVMRRVNLFVGIDSGPMHIAAAMNRPIVALFGCTKPEWILPSGVSHMRGVHIQGLDCFGCRHALPFGRTFADCHKDQPYCMNNLSVEMVTSEIERVLQ